MSLPGAQQTASSIQPKDRSSPCTTAGNATLPFVLRKGLPGLPTARSRAPPLSMMGYDDRPMNLEFARQCLPDGLFDRWYKDLTLRRTDPTELNFMDFVAHWDRVRREEAPHPCDWPLPAP